MLETPSLLEISRCIDQGGLICLRRGLCDEVRHNEKGNLSPIQINEIDAALNLNCVPPPGSDCILEGWFDSPIGHAVISNEYRDPDHIADLERRLRREAEPRIRRSIGRWLLDALAAGGNTMRGGEDAPPTFPIIF